MKVAIVLAQSAQYSPTARPGAIQLTVAEIVKYSQFRETIFVLGSPIEPTDGIEHHPFVGGRFVSTGGGRKRQFRKQWFHALREELLRIQPDVVVVQQSPTVAGFLSRTFANLTVVLHRHDAQPVSSPFKRWMQNWNMRQSDLILVNSEFVKKHHQENRGLKDHRIEVLYNGVLFPNEKAGTPTKQNIIIAVAAMVPKKGAHLFIEAMSVLLKKHDDWKAVFVSETSGKAMEDYRLAIFSQIDELGDKIEWFDYLKHEDVLNLYEQARIAVVPSQVDEAFGKTALEAVLGQCAVVSSGRGGLPEITGSFCEYPQEQTVAAYCAAIEKLMMNATVREELANKAYSRASKMFDAKKIAQDFDDFIKGAVDSRL